MKLSFTIGLLALVTLSYLHALDFSLPKDKLREQILKITPLGISKSEAGCLIKSKIKPKTFYHFSPPANMPKGEFWPLGGKNISETFGCNLGKTDGWPLPFFTLTYTQVDADWGFNSTGALIDVWVYKHPTGL